MSGPLDFAVVLSSAALLDIATRQQTAMSAVFVNVPAIRPLEKRQRPGPRVATPGQKPSATRTTTETIHQAPEGHSQTQPTSPPATVEDESVVAEALAEMLGALEARATAMKQDATITWACQEEIAEWDARRQALAGVKPDRGVAEQAEQLIAQSESIATQAYELAKKREEREYLLKAITESLQAAGYFTDTPAASRSGSLSEPVTLVARKAGKEVTVLVPMGEGLIKSVWDGFAGEHCVDSFIDYIDEMRKRGLAVNPTRTDIADRPKLREAGRKDLPRSGSMGS